MQRHEACAIKGQTAKKKAQLQEGKSLKVKIKELQNPNFSDLDYIDVIVCPNKSKVAVTSSAELVHIFPRCSFLLFHSGLFIGVNGCRQNLQLVFILSFYSSCSVTKKPTTFYSFEFFFCPLNSHCNFFLNMMDSTSVFIPVKNSNIAEFEVFVRIQTVFEYFSFQP